MSTGTCSRQCAQGWVEDGDHPHAELARGLGDGGAELANLGSRASPMRGADAGADLDLALQELVGDPRRQPLLAAGHELRRLRAGQRPGLRIDQQIFFLDADREFRAVAGHLFPPAALAGASGKIPVPSSGRVGVVKEFRWCAGAPKCRWVAKVYGDFFDVQLMYIACTSHVPTKQVVSDC